MEPRARPAPPMRVPPVASAPGLPAQDRRHSAAGDVQTPPARAALERQLEPATIHLAPEMEPLGEAESELPGRLRVLQTPGAPSDRAARGIPVEALECPGPAQVPRRVKPGGASAETPASAALRRRPDPRSPGSRVPPERAARDCPAREPQVLERREVETDHAASPCRGRRRGEPVGQRAVLSLEQAHAYEPEADLEDHLLPGRSRCRARWRAIRPAAVEAGSYREAVLGQLSRAGPASIVLDRSLDRALS